MSYLKQEIHFPRGSDGKESACNEGDPGSVPGSEKSPGVENGNPLQYACLENSMDRRVWQAIVHGVKELDTAEQLTHITRNLRNCEQILKLSS